MAGGFEYAEVVFLIQELVHAGKKVIGFDLVEVGPSDDEWDANVGARLLYKLSNLMLKSQGNEVLTSSPAAAYGLHPSKALTAWMRSACPQRKEKLGTVQISLRMQPLCLFFAPQCPLSENYCLQTNVLQAQYLSEGCSSSLMIPGALFSSEEINDFLQRYQLDVPVLLDPDKYLCDVLGATITPEAFLTDPAGQTLYSEPLTTGRLIWERNGKW